MAYRASGSKLMENGKEIQLFGVNLVGMELKDAIIGGLWSGVSFDQLLDGVVARGFNCVRLPITSRTLSNVAIDEDIAGVWNSANSQLKGKKSMEVCDLLIEGLEKRGIHYFFDLHYLEDGLPEGNIPALWYTANYPESQWLNDLKFIAQRYKGKPGFIGIDTKNEPNEKACTWGDGNPKTDWKAASERSFEAINSVNQDIIIIVEWLGTVPGLKQLTDKPLNIPLDRLALSPHVYGPSVWADFGEGFKDASFPKNMPKIWDKFFGTIGKKQLVIVGEFGGNYGREERGDLDKKWQDEFAAYLKSSGVNNFTYWQYGPNSWGTGGVLDNDWKTVREDKMSMLKVIKTDKATLVGKAIGGSVEPPVNPPVSGSFKVGDSVRLKKEGNVMKITAFETTDRAVLSSSVMMGFQRLVFHTDLLEKT